MLEVQEQQVLLEVRGIQVLLDRVLLLVVLEIQEPQVRQEQREQREQQALLHHSADQLHG
jgi:hypothetical protein